MSRFPRTGARHCRPACWSKGLLSALIATVLATGALADEGEGLYRDGHYESAIELWRSRAEAGDVAAAYRLGATLADGVVAPRDLAAAAYWLELAAEGGELAAQLDIATLYDNGWGVQRSHAKAARWYRSAARLGDPASQFNLASMYEQGQGVERDPVAAYRWYALAERGGMGALARDGLDRVSDQLSGQEMRTLRAEALLRDARDGAAPDALHPDHEASSARAASIPTSEKTDSDDPTTDVVGAEIVKTEVPTRRIP